MFDLWIQLVILALISMLPFGEGRLAIILGVLSTNIDIFGYEIGGFGLSPIFVFFYTLFFNIIGIIIGYFFFKYIIDYFLHIKWIEKLHDYYVEKKLKKVKPYIDKFGFMGLMLFVGIPLPGSGVWTSALIANVLEVDFKKYFYPCFLGIIVALFITVILTVKTLSFF